MTAHVAHNQTLQIFYFNVSFGADFTVYTWYFATAFDKVPHMQLFMQ